MASIGMDIMLSVTGGLLLKLFQAPVGTVHVVLLQCAHVYRPTYILYIRNTYSIFMHCVNTAKITNMSVMSLRHAGFFVYVYLSQFSRSVIAL